MKIFKNSILKQTVGIFITAVLLSFTGSCKNENKEGEIIEADPTTEIDTIANRQVQVRTFEGNLGTLNKEANGGEEVTGVVSLRVEGDLMRIRVNAEGLDPEMMHLQHLQTSQTGQDVNCPGGNADANNDGIIDVAEVSGEATGLRIIPLNMGPSSLEVNVDTYPKSNINGALQFERTISYDSLQTAVRETYGIDSLDFTKFTYIIQGVNPEGSKIPQSAQTVANVPTYASIPVGCAKLVETN